MPCGFSFHILSSFRFNDEHRRNILLSSSVRNISFRWDVHQSLAYIFYSFKNSSMYRECCQKYIKFPLYFIRVRGNYLCETVCVNFLFINTFVLLYQNFKSFERYIICLLCCWLSFIILCWRDNFVESLYSRRILNVYDLYINLFHLDVYRGSVVHS